jgi:PIN domain nuclease of toxin-antitoxin system
MNCLLDTHAFLWAAFIPRKLSVRAHKALIDPENEVFVSVVSFWEISLKFSLGKIEMAGVAPEDLPDVARRMGCELLELDSEDAASFHKLSRAAHKDPFDRMLVYQAIRRHKRLISCDAALAVYAPQGLELLW